MTLPTNGGVSSQDERIADLEDTVGESELTELEQEEQLSAQHDETVRRMNVDALQKLIDFQQTTAENARRKNSKRVGGSEYKGSPRKKKAKVSRSHVSRPPLSFRSSGARTRPPSSRASSNGTMTESVLDTFGHAFDLSSAWNQSTRLVRVSFFLYIDSCIHFGNDLDYRILLATSCCHKFRLRTDPQTSATIA